MTDYDGQLLLLGRIDGKLDSVISRQDAQDTRIAVLEADLKSITVKVLMLAGAIGAAGGGVYNAIFGG